MAPTVQPQPPTLPAPGNEGAARPRRRWPRRLAAALGVALALVAVALVLTVSPEDDGPYPDGLTWEQHETRDGLVTRRWTVGVPDGAGPGPHPAIVSLHPLGGNRAGWATETDLAALAAEQGFVMVVPQGLWGMWNAGQCCGPASALGIDDVGFLDEVMERTAGRDDVDPDRVSMVGLSNGGLMVAEYLCEGSVRPAAAAAVAVIPWELDGCDGEVPLLVSVGTDDEVFPFDGGRTWMGTLASGRSSQSWDEFTEQATAAWGCTDEPGAEVFSAFSRPQEPQTEWRRTEHLACRSPLTLTVVEDVPHTWLWGGDWSHTREVLRFIEAQEAPAT